MDRVSQEARSRNMSRVRGRNTAPELTVRRLLRSMGRGYRLHARDLPGRPDLVFRGRRKAIFVNGCFWHQHPGCARATIPETRREFWLAKLNRNIERDGQALTALAALGWTALTVWECETADLDRLRAKLLDFLTA